jgi:chemosensory pili system protein ChpA (sensor histidine kinase/response regulator)
MSETRDPNELMDAAQDLAPLAWVIDEIRASLGAAVSGVKTFLGSKQDLDALRNARNHIHQANGALQLLDLRGVALVTDGIEHLLRRWEGAAEECVPSSVRTVETAVAAIVAYLEGLLSGRPNQPVRLYPYYRDVLLLNRAPRVHPADLVFPDLTRRPAFHTIETRPLTADQLRVRRVHFEEGLLGFLRDSEDAKARARMLEALADLERLPQRGLARSFWWVVRGLLEALAARAVPVDVDLKRVLARLNLQLRRLIDGGGAVAERLMVDTLYYVGRAEGNLPRVSEAKRLFGLDALIPPDFERATLTAVDAEALRGLKEALSQAKTHWSHIVGGAAELPRFVAEVRQARAAAQRVEAQALADVLAALEAVSERYPALAGEAREALALEVASALLFAEIGADDLPQVDPAYAERAAVLGARLRSALAGGALPEATPWLSELARKAQDRLTMGSVVAETQATLREIEQRLDRYFRDPAQRAGLADTDPMFDQLCGVLSVLGYDDPVAALRSVQQSVRAFARPDAAPAPEEFARVAQNLGAIGFFVETLGQDGERPRSMFRYDPAAGVFSADLAQTPATADAVAAPPDDFLHPPRTIDLRAEPGPRAAAKAPAENVEAAAAQHVGQVHMLAQRLSVAPGDASAVRALAGVLAQLTAEADLLDDATLKRKVSRANQLRQEFDRKADAAVARELRALFAPPEAPAAPPPTAPLPASQAAADRELHQIFIEEANEVLDGVESQLAELSAARGDPATLTTVRRAFHTLKGSSRMVGLKAFGEAAWAIEQCFNLWLAQERAASDDLLGLAEFASRRMREWIARIDADPHAVIDVAPLVRAAQQVREGQRFEAEPTAGAAAAAEASRPPPKATGSAVDQPPSALPASRPDGAPSASPAAAPPLHDAAATVQPAAVDTAEAGDRTDAGANDDIRRIGPIEISHGLYSVFINEADECIRALTHDVAEWRYEPGRLVAPHSVRCAHSLAGISATVGLAPVWAIADPLDDLMHELAGQSHPLAPARGTGHALAAAQIDTLERVIERLRGMLHEFAAGLYPSEAPLEVAAVQELLAVVRAASALRAAPGGPAQLQPVPGAPAAAADPGAPAMAAAQPIGQQIGPAAAPAQVEADSGATGFSPVAAAEPSSDGADAGSASRGGAPDGPLPEPLPVFASGDDEPLSVPTDGEAPQEPEAALSRVQDELDPDLLEVFVTEAHDLLPAISTSLRALAARPDDREVARELMRQLHTVKGSARMAGAMRLGELVHDMETRIESTMPMSKVPAALVEDLQAQYDQAMSLFERLQHPAAQRAEAPAPAAAGPVSTAPDAQVQPPAADPGADARRAAAPDQAQASDAPLAPVIDLAAARETSAVRAEPRPPAPAAAPAQPGPGASFIRVRADVLDKLVDQAGEVSIARSKLENEVTTLKTSLVDLTDNIQRLRTQLREVEIQADAQIQARGDKLDRDSAEFDPLEFDRYTRLQELTRLLAESVEDVAMVQSNMLKGLTLADGDLSSQSRLTRELQQQLMRVRLVPFASLSERLYRVARQAAKELDKRVNLDVRGGATEVDRGVLERMSGPFEHLIRNAIVHGIEAPGQRRAAGKSETGELAIDVRQEGNEIHITVADDGAGLNLEKIRARGVALGLLGAQQAVTDRDLTELIFAPGFSTASEVTELAGRGVGMDVVRAELASFGGRVTVASEAGRGTRFTLYLPLTLAVTQVVLATVGERRYAIPAGMVEQVRRYKPGQLGQALNEGFIDIAPVGQIVLRPLAQLLGEDYVPHHARQMPVVLMKSGEDRLAVAVDDVSSSQEVVVKNVGKQVSRLAGILGATILGNGEIVLIVNPVQLITRAPEPVSLAAASAPAAAVARAGGEAPRLRERLSAASSLTPEAPPLVMVVDDSLTVRRVSQRLLERNGYDVMLAKDGVDALRQLQDQRPDIMLVDIEMPRMDGFDLTRNVRGNRQTHDIPIIMITSRTAEKHRNLAFEIGVNEYLGKPYQEEELLGLIRRLVAERSTV